MSENRNDTVINHDTNTVNNIKKQK